MRSVVSYLVVVTLALHALLGCCWHHAHEPDARLSQVEVQSTRAVESCDCHRHGARELAENDQKPPVPSTPVDHSSDSCGNKCQYVAVSRVQVDHSLDFSVLDFLPAESSVASSSEITAVRYGSDGAPIGPPPLRLHLLHQLLLI